MGEIVSKVRKKDRSEVWIDIYGKLRSDGNIIDAWLVDITERKKIEEELKQNEEKYRLLVDNAPVGVGLIKNNNAVYCNNSYMNTLGYDSLEELLQVPVLDTLAPDEREAAIERMKKYDNNNTLKPVVMKALKKDGTIRHVQMSGNNVIINGEIYRQTIMMDITDRIEAEEELKQNEEKYRSLVDNMFVGVSISEGDYYIYVNRSQLNILGYDSMEQLSSKPISNLIIPEERDIHYDRLKKYSDGIDVPSTIFRIIRKDGGIRTVHVAGNNIIINGKKYRQNVMLDIDRKGKSRERTSMEFISS